MPIAPIAGAWQRFLIKAGVEVGGAIAAYLLDDFTEGTSDNSVEAVGWVRVQVCWSRATPTGTAEDLAMVTFDLVNLTGGAVDKTFTAGDFTAIDAALNTWLTAIRGWQSATHSCHSFRYYSMAFDPPAWPARRFAISGPPIHVTTLTPVAGAGPNNAYQVSATVTERTALAGHWGRIYIPGLGSSSFDGFGRILPGGRNVFRDATAALFATLRAADFYPVVPMTQHNKAPAFGLMGIQSISVDDIPDVQRRRRPKTVVARSVSP